MREERGEGGQEEGTKIHRSSKWQVLLESEAGDWKEVHELEKIRVEVV